MDGIKAKNGKYSKLNIESKKENMLHGFIYHNGINNTS